MILLVFAILFLDPVTVSGGRLNSDSLLSLEIHRVHFGTHCIFPTDFMYRFYSASVVEYTFGDSGFTAVDMSLRRSISSSQR